MAGNTVQTLGVHLTGWSGHFSRNSFRSMHDHAMVSKCHITILVMRHGGGGDVVMVNGGGNHSSGGVVVGALTVVLSVIVAAIVSLSTVGGTGRSDGSVGRDDAAGALQDHLIAVGEGGGYGQQGGDDKDLFDQID